MSHPPLRINYRTFTVFVVVGLLMLAVGGVMVLGAGQSRLRQSFGGHLAEIADQTAAAVDSYVYRRAIDASILAAVPDVRSAAATSSATAFDSAETRRLDRQWEGQRKAPQALAGLLETPASRFLSEVTRNDPTYRELLLADRNGRLVAASSMTSDYYQGDEDWFSRTLAEGSRPNVGGISWDDSANSWALEISVPVMEPEGKQAAGVLKALVDVREMAAAVSSVRLGASGDAALVNDDGTMVLTAGSPGRGTTFFAADLLRERMQAAASRESAQDIYFSARSGDASTRLIGVGVSQLRASYPHLEWLVVASQAESELFAPVRYQLWSLLAVLGLTATGVLALALWFSLRLAAPLPDEELHLVRHAKVETIDG